MPDQTSPRATGHPARAVSRRNLLRSAGAASFGAAILAACGGGGDDSSSAGDGGETAAPSPTGQQDLAQQALAAAGVDAEVNLAPLIAIPELLTGTDFMGFGLSDPQRNLINDAAIEAWLVHADSNEVVTGPVQPAFYQFDEVRGAYAFETSASQPGLHQLVVAMQDGSGAGTAAVQVVPPDQSTAPAPGEQLPALDTPTEQDPKNLEQLCTRQPPCGMHTLTVAEALEAGRPLVLTVATPQFCQTAVCGPVVDVVVDQQQEFGDAVQFIHVEVFTDAGNTFTDTVRELQLQSEPWTWIVDAEGTIQSRFGGPVVPSLLSEAIAVVA